MKDRRNILLKYSVTALCAAAMVLFIIWLRDLDNAPNLAERYRVISDAFTVPGVRLVMIGALVWVSTEGFFDGLSYAFNRAGSMLIPFFKKSLKHQNYYDYKMSKQEKRAKGYSFLFFVGLAYLAVGVVFVFLYEGV